MWWVVSGRILRLQNDDVQGSLIGIHSVPRSANHPACRECNTDAAGVQHGLCRGMLLDT